MSMLINVLLKGSQYEELKASSILKDYIYMYNIMAIFFAS